MLPSMPWSSKRYLSFRLSHQNIVLFSLLSHPCHMPGPTHFPRESPRIKFYKNIKFTHQTTNYMHCPACKCNTFTATEHLYHYYHYSVKGVTNRPFNSAL
jgi:hypothetical protein